MIMKYLFLPVIGMIIQILFILTEQKEKYLPAVILKGTASCVFILFGILSSRICTNGSFAAWIIAGLVFGGIGDVCLNLRFLLKDSQKIFLIGVAAFLLGHIMYLIALIPRSGSTLWVTLALGIVIAFLLLKWIFANIREVKQVMKIFGYVYIGAVVLMTAVSLGVLIKDPSVKGNLTFFIGALLFTASDIILIFNMFGEKKVWMRPTNLTLYYLGQLLIAGSLQLL